MAFGTPIGERLTLESDLSYEQRIRIWGGVGYSASIFCTAPHAILVRTIVLVDHRALKHCPRRLQIWLPDDLQSLVAYGDADARAKLIWSVLRGLSCKVCLAGPIEAEPELIHCSGTMQRDAIEAVDISQLSLSET